jgi:uncharacterized protein (TIGR00369 family)
MSAAPDHLPQAPEAWLAWGSEILQTQAFSVLLGTKLTALDWGRCELSLPIAAQLLQQHGFVHGGVVSYLADNALTYAGGTALGSNALTLEFKINYVRPAVGELLIARAQAEATGKTQSVCVCRVYAVKAGVEKLCAVAQGTIVPAPNKA